MSSSVSSGVTSSLSSSISLSVSSSVSSSMSSSVSSSSVSSSNQLLISKQHLAESLGPSQWKSYLACLKQWFKRVINKETFDCEARKLCPDRKSIQFHNEFLLAIFSTCQSLGAAAPPVVSVASVGKTEAALPEAPSLKTTATSAAVAAPYVPAAAAAAATAVTTVAAAPGGISSSTASLPASLPSPTQTPSTATATPTPTPTPTPTATTTSSKSKEKRHKKDTKTKKTKTNKISFHNNFTPTNPLAYCHQIVLKPPEEEQGLTFSSRERTLPDIALIHGRMLVAAWDSGLDQVQDSAVRFLTDAVQTHVRSLLTNLVKQRNSYKLRNERFAHHFASEHLNSYSRNADKAREAMQDQPPSSSLEIAEDDAMFQLGCGVNSTNTRSGVRPPLGLFQLRDMLQTNKNCVASHTVSAINMERILNSMEHPSAEEAAQEDIHRQAKVLRLDYEDHQQLIRPW